MPRPMIVKRLWEIVKERDLLVSEDMCISVVVIYVTVYLGLYLALLTYFTA